MKSKLALFSIIVPCVSVLIASALAQTTGSPNSASTTNSGSSAYGRGSFSDNQVPTTSAANSARDPLVGPSPTAQPAPEGQATSLFSRATTIYGINRNDWRVHNEEAAIAPIVQQLKDAKSDSEIEKLKGQLDEALEKSFAMRQKRHSQEIEELEAKVKTLKELVAKRQEKRREIVANRRDQILRDAQGLGW
jgi:peptidoglycan hydrolase CwlO-like protein